MFGRWLIAARQAGLLPVSLHALGKADYGVDEWLRTIPPIALEILRDLFGYDEPLPSSLLPETESLSPTPSVTTFLVSTQTPGGPGFATPSATLSPSATPTPTSTGTATITITPLVWTATVEPTSGFLPSQTMTSPPGISSPTPGPQFTSTSTEFPPTEATKTPTPPPITPSNTPTIQPPTDTSIPPPTIPPPSTDVPTPTLPIPPTPRPTHDPTLDLTPTGQYTPGPTKSPNK
jgi:hypothetical protein